MKFVTLKSIFTGFISNTLTTLFLLTFLSTVLSAQTISDFITGGTYFIDHIGSDKRLKSNNAGTDLVAVNKTDSENRSKWKFVDAKEGYVYIQCVANNTRLQGMSKALNDGSAVRLGEKSFAGDWVKWKLVSVGNNWFIENRGHKTYLNINSNAQIGFGSTTWNGAWTQWKITKTTAGKTFGLNTFSPSNNNSTKLGKNEEVTLNFSEAVNLATAKTIDVEINKMPSNNKINWSRGSAKQLKLKNKTNWPEGSLVTIKIKSSTKSASGASFSGRNEFEFIVDTSKDFGFKREPINTLVKRNNGKHNIPLNVVLPANKVNKVPVHIWVHGGGWKGGTLAESEISGSPHSRYLAEELGIATLDVAYRSLGSKGTFTQAMEDIASAYQWVINNATKYNFDLDKIFISGGSAGTPLAALFAQRQNKIKAFIGFNGIYNFVDNPESKFPANNAKPYEYCKPSCRDNSAYFNLRNNPPISLLLHGNNDTEINFSQSKQFEKQVIDKGGYARAEIYSNEEHGFFNIGELQYQDCLWEMARFLRNNKLVQTNANPVQAEFYIDHIGSNKRLKSNSADNDLLVVDIYDTGVRTNWKLIDAGKDYYYIQCVANGQRLRGISGVLSDGSIVHLSPTTNAGDWVKWKLIPAGNGYYFIQNKGHNTRLFVTSNAQVAFGDIAWDGPYTQWKITNKSTNALFKESAKSSALSLKKNLHLYPNPAQDYLQIQFYKQVDNAEITLFDLHGKLVLTQAIRNVSETSIDVSKLISGNYFIRIQAGDVVETQKIIKH